MELLDVTDFKNPGTMLEVLWSHSFNRQMDAMGY